MFVEIIEKLSQFERFAIRFLLSPVWNGQIMKTYTFKKNNKKVRTKYLFTEFCYTFELSVQYVGGVPIKKKTSFLSPLFKIKIVPIVR